MDDSKELQILNLKRDKGLVKTHARVVSSLESLIKEGSLAPGDQLLSERRLAEELGVSRPTIREALTALEAMGHLKRTRAGGIVVQDNSINVITRILAVGMTREQQSVYDLLDVRCVVEGYAAGLAAREADELDRLSIGNVVAKYKRDIDNGVSTEESDTEFHFAVSEAAHNGVLLRVMEILLGLTREVFGPSRKILHTHRSLREAFGEQHEAIYEAIASGEEGIARDKMVAHIMYTSNALKRLQNGA